ncbi:MAG: tRNA guanosine(34) transglycosylase Tgt [Candidatus Yonathbacteria bacterium]|nr:tRNA guanosine(34) transglycosylase Tgt [Candidatus Yonathbacteria bacterium]
MSPLKFNIEKKLKNGLGRVGVLTTPHGEIKTPAFVTVGTKATVKSLSPEQVKNLGAQVVLANTYHLYLEPGDKTIKEAGEIHTFMNWNGPTMTDSGGFQAFSLGAAFGKGVSKIAKGEVAEEENVGSQEEPTMAKIDEDGVTFKSYIDGSEHKFTPERSIEIQHNIGADMIFAFDECTSPRASHEYQKEAMDRTHRWAQRSLDAHKINIEASKKQGLLGIVQGGRFQDLREESAKTISKMDFDGFGIGGSFTKEDMNTAVGWVNKLLPEDKPRHLLGIGEPADLFGGVENGSDLFDCVAPTRIARNGSLYTNNGRINIFNTQFRSDFKPIDSSCACYTCAHYTRAYLAHLFRSKEMFAATLASIHNLYFTVKLVDKIRQSILDGNFLKLKEEFLKIYYR